MPADLAASDDADTMITKITGTKGLPQGPMGPPPGPPPTGGVNGNSGLLFDSSSSGVLGSSLTGDQQNTLNELSSLLGTDSGGPLDQLKSGTSLSDLFGAQGVDQKSISAVLQDSLLFDAKG